MMLKKGQLPILIVFFLILIVFSAEFIVMKNYEFLGYAAIIVLLFLIVLMANKKISIPNYVLWLLVFWVTLHLSGGGISIYGKRLYDLILVNIVGEPYNIFRYDQFVHIIGFGAATLFAFYLLKPLLNNMKSKISLGVVVIMAGLGIGALNEIVEFIITVVVPSTGIGGYINNSLDLVADLIGAVLAYSLISIKEK